jgi:hypothetical protein
VNLLNLPDYDISRVEQSARDYRVHSEFRFPFGVRVMAIDNVLRVDGGGKCYGFSPAERGFEAEPNGANLKGVRVVIDHAGNALAGVVSECLEGGNGRHYAHIDLRIGEPYEVVETASGWGVKRPNPAHAEFMAYLYSESGPAGGDVSSIPASALLAEFLSRDEANEALAGLWSGDASEEDYDWLEQE